MIGSTEADPNLVVSSIDSNILYLTVVEHLEIQIHGLQASREDAAERGTGFLPVRVGRRHRCDE